MKSVIVALTIALVFTSGFTCVKHVKYTEEQMQEIEKEKLKALDITKLFTKDGCTVYRFYDHSYHRYFTNCTETISSTSHSRRVGNTTRTEVIPDNNKTTKVGTK